MKKTIIFGLLIIGILIVSGCAGQSRSVTEVSGVNIIDVEPQPFNPELYDCPYEANLVAKVILNKDNSEYYASCQIIINGERKGETFVRQIPNIRNIIQIDPNLETNNIGLCCKKSDISNEEVCDYFNFRCR